MKEVCIGEGGSVKDELTGAIKYDGFKKAGWLSEKKAKVVLKARKKIFHLFMDVMKPKRTEKVIDVGVAPVIGIAGAKTITNNFFERLYPYTAQITATSIEDAKCLEQEFPGLKFVQTKPYTTPFSDGMFDVLFCNAVVEHTGTRKQQKKFIHEYCRVSKRFFFTTPNRWFPVEPHSALPLVHWLPPVLLRKVLNITGKEALADENILNLLSARDFLGLFPKQAKVKLLRVKTMGFTSNLIVYGEWNENES